MKKINLLKPDIHNGYLNHGKGQEINYLAIPDTIGISELKEDVKNGAAHFKEVIDFVAKKPSQFVVINCNNEEEGLMAASYIAAIYNKRDKLSLYDYEEEDEVDDKVDLEVTDFEDEDVLDEGYDDREEDWEAESQWHENPWKIPVIKSSELFACNPFGFNSYFSGGMGMGGVSSPKNNLPYWYYTRKENICIVNYVFNDSFGFGSNDIVEKLKRFKNNRHVFVVCVAVDSSCEPEDSFEAQTVKEQMCELILEYTAGTLNIVTEESAKGKYYALLLENWVQQYGYELKKGFPVKKAANSITAINNSAKSALIEKVVRYVIKDEREAKILAEADFDILEQFKLLGTDLKKKEHKSVKRLENELVGMEGVKEQIKGIVEVMKYNKRRLKLGLKTGNYHNVHMMIGAPGTAKTTVAEILGNIMVEEKLLANNRFISVNGAELKGMFVGHSAPKVKSLFDNYDIIFIDEAYAVAAVRDGDTDSFSQEAIAQLIVELEKHGMDRLVMFAGYGGYGVSENDNKMKNFMDSNPGIRSRINSTIYFESYTPDQMVQIFRCQAKMNQFTLPSEADEIVKSFFEDRVERSDFGNGREARSLLENSMVEAAKRLAKVPEEKLTSKLMREIKLQDVENAIRRMQQSSVVQGGVVKAQIGF